MYTSDRYAGYTQYTPDKKGHTSPPPAQMPHTSSRGNGVGGGGRGGRVDLEASEEEAEEEARRVVLAAGDTLCRRCGVW
jgi:hypothetical protein